MPAADFVIPVVTDGTLVDWVVTPGTIINKNWIDNTLFAWILTAIKNDSYAETTPADLIGQVLQGDLTPPLYVESEDTHTNSGASDSTRVFVKGSSYAINLGTSQFYAGGWAELGVGGNCIVAAFSNADYYKHIALGLYESGGVLTLDTTESAEAATAGALNDPPAYGGSWKKVANIIVQNDGTTGVAGKILDIAQSDITALGLIVPNWEPQVPITAKLYGSLVTGRIDVAEVIPFNGEIISCAAVLENTGSGGSNLVVDININGTTIFSPSANNPTITANSGTDQSDIVLAADIDTTSLSSGDVISFDIDSAPTASENLRVTLWVLPEQS